MRVKVNHIDILETLLYYFRQCEDVLKDKFCDTPYFFNIDANNGQLSFHIWYIIFRWTEYTAASSFAKKDLLRIPLKILLHDITSKLRVIILPHTSSPDNNIKLIIPQGRVEGPHISVVIQTQIWLLEAQLLWSAGVDDVARASIIYSKSCWKTICNSDC